jgi:hypothetical protein
MRLLVLCSLIAMGGCAASAVPPAGSDAPAAPAPAAERSAKVSKAPFDLPPGFKPTRMNGEIYYCRKMVVLGSRFPKQLCLREDELKQHMARTEAMKRDKDQISHVCSQKDGCANE